METDNSPEAVNRRRLYRRLRRNVRLGQGFLWLLPLVYVLLLLTVVSNRPKPPSIDPADSYSLDSVLGRPKEGVASWLEKTFGPEDGSQAQASPVTYPRPLGKMFWILDLLLILASLGLAGYAERHPLPAFKIAPFLVAPLLVYLLSSPPDIGPRDRGVMGTVAVWVATSARASAGFVKKMTDLE